MQSSLTSFFLSKLFHLRVAHLHPLSSMLQPQGPLSKLTSQSRLCVHTHMYCTWSILCAHAYTSPQSLDGDQNCIPFDQPHLFTCVTTVVIRTFSAMCSIHRGVCFSVATHTHSHAHTYTHIYTGS